MTKPTLNTSRLGLVTLVCLLTFRVGAQDIASLISSIGRSGGTIQGSQEKKTKPLKQLLSELESRYKVSFNYDSELIRHVVVENREVSADLEAALNTLLEQQELKCRKIGDKSYVIYPKQETPEIPKSLPVKSPDAWLELEQQSQLATVTGSLRPTLIAASKRIEFTVRGRVTDEANQGLPGVSVVLKGTTTGVSTDANGAYSLTLGDGSGILIFSYIGYVSSEVPVNNQTVIDVQLLADVKSLSEVVVVGYQSQKRSDIVGAVSVVDTKEMKKTQVASVGEMLQGRAAGVTVTSSGAPGQTSAVKIRGTSSITGQDSPLYVIDGMFIDGAYPDFNPNDVESIQVLKDAAATALYGSRGMNGVIIVTTKRGKSGPPKLSYNMYVGTQSIPRRLPLMNAAQFRTVNSLAYTNAGRTPQSFLNADTDWQEALFKTGVITDHNLTLSGGSDKANYLIGANYFHQDGTIVGPSFRRYQFRVNSEMRKGIFRIGENLMMSRNNTVNINGNPFQEVLRMLPTIPVYNPQTTSGYGYGGGEALNNTFGTNPIALQEHYSNTTGSNKVFGSVYVEADITKFLTYKLNMGLDFSQFANKYFERIGAIRQNNPDGGPAFVRDTWGEFFNTLIENTLNFNHTFGKHSVSALVGYTQQKNNYSEIQPQVQGLNGEYWVQNNGTQAPQTRGFINISTLASWLGSVNYSFDDKYLLQLNARRDGSSRVGLNHQYGTFPSASVGWRISKEGFMQDLGFISDLKLRASYGEVGNQAIPLYSTSPVIDYNLNYVLANSVVQGAINRRIVNPDIRWERKATTNVGLDLALLQNRILLSADYFVSKTKDLLLDVPIPISAGNEGPNPTDNLGAIQNKGLELALTYQETKGDFRYSITANMTSIRNKVLALVPANGNQPLYGFGQVIRLAVDEPISFYTLRTDGVFQNQGEIDQSAQKGEVAPGDIRFKDINGDGKINFDDRERAGSPFPKLEYGLNLSGAYKGIDLTAFFAGVAGNMIFNDGLFWTGRYNDNGNYRTDDVYWTGPGTSNSVSRPVYGDPSRSPTYQSDRWLEKGDYFRLKTIQLGYSLPVDLIGKVKGFSSLRVYVSGQNVFTLTGYRGYNPEVTGGDNNNSSLNRGVDNGFYPVNRTFSIGLQAGF